MVNSIIKFRKCNFSIAALAITEQPFSQVVFKARPIDGHYSVDILTGIRTQLEKASLVSAFLTDEEAFKSPKPIENDKAELSTPKHRAKFEDLKYAHFCIAKFLICKLGSMSLQE